MLSGNQDGPVVIIGDPSSVFVQLPARIWRERGHEVVVVTSRIWDGSDRLADGTRVVSVEAEPGRQLTRELSLLCPILEALETELAAMPDAAREAARMGWGVDKPLPSIVPVAWDGALIADYVRSLQPRVVLGQETFAYGLATALCYGAPRGLMVWGGDVQFFADTSPVTRALSRFVLQSVETVLVAGPALERRVVEHLGVRPANCVEFSFGVDLETFYPAGAADRAAARRVLGLSPDTSTVMNLRRFDPLWGSDLVLEAFLRLADMVPEVQFLLPGGATNEPRIAAARSRIASRGHEARFVFLEGQIPLDTYAVLLRASDVGVSLAQWDEPLSWSVLQGIATGLPVVVSDQEAYRRVNGRGAALAVVPPSDVEGVVGEVRTLLFDTDRRRRLQAANQEYLARHQDQRRALAELLSRLECPSSERRASVVG